MTLRISVTFEDIVNLNYVASHTRSYVVTADVDQVQVIRAVHQLLSEYGEMQ